MIISNPITLISPERRYTTLVARLFMPLKQIETGKYRDHRQHQTKTTDKRFRKHESSGRIRIRVKYVPHTIRSQGRTQDRVRHMPD